MEKYEKFDTDVCKNEELILKAIKEHLKIEDIDEIKMMEKKLIYSLLN